MTIHENKLIHKPNRDIITKPSATPAVVLLIALLFILLLALASCGGSSVTTVTMKDFGFDPGTITIKQGETVTWKNEDRRARQVMSGAPPVMTDDFVSPVIKRGESWSFTFENTGEYPYHDMVGGSLGVVVVEE